MCNIMCVERELFSQSGVRMVNWFFALHHGKCIDTQDIEGGILVNCIFLYRAGMSDAMYCE